MGKPKRFGDLEVTYDPAHEEREWIVQRIGWAVMLLLAAAALAGLLGPGPLSDVAAGQIGSPLRVEYERFVRYQAPGELRFYCRPEGKDKFQLSFDRAFIEATEIKEISPEPLETSAHGEKYSYTFRRTGGEEQLVTFRIEGDQFGKTKTEVQLEEGAKVELRQFYWP